jgi:hypothetical protein
MVFGSVGDSNRLSVPIIRDNRYDSGASFGRVHTPHALWTPSGAKSVRWRNEWIERLGDKLNDAIKERFTGK